MVAKLLFCWHNITIPQISFKELTDNISKNWATIDEESKNYCAMLSEMGRKRYKKNMSSFIASRKIMELKEEQSMMMAAKERIGNNRAVGTPPRAKHAPRPSAPPAIHAVTPDRPHTVKSYVHRAPKHHPAVVTPPYNPYANRRPMYYPNTPDYGHVSGPPPLPPRPPPVPIHISSPYNIYPRAAHHPGVPRPLPPPMPSTSSAHEHEFNHHYANHTCAYHAGYYQHTARHTKHRPNHPGHHPHERHDPPHEQAAPPHWNPDTQREAADSYRPNESQRFKTEEMHCVHSTSTHANVPGNDDSQPKAVAEPIKTNSDTRKIHPTMSFDSITSNQMRFNFSYENLTTHGEDKVQHDGHSEEEEEEESILGLLREELIPLDSGIAFQLSWEDVQL